MVYKNLGYVFDHRYTGFDTAIIRAILSVPGHTFFAVYMGNYLGLAKVADINKKEDLRRKNLFLSLLIPTLLHGTFDFLLSVQGIAFDLTLIVLLILLYYFAIKKINDTSKLYHSINVNYNYCPICGSRVDSNFCPYCGNKLD